MKKKVVVVVEVAVAVEVVVVVAVAVEFADLQISTTAVVEVGLQILRLAADPQIFRMPAAAAAAAAECLESQKWIGFETELTAVVAVAGHQIGLAGRTWMPAADLEVDFQKLRTLQAVVQK